MNAKIRNPNERLKAARITAGYKTVKVFCEATEQTGTPISYNRMLNLERTSLPTPQELNTLREVLSISADCLLCGHCNTICDRINANAVHLNKAQVDLLLELTLANAQVLKGNMLNDTH